MLFLKLRNQINIFFSKRFCLHILIAAVYCSGCSSSDEDPIHQFEFQIANQSQFDLEYVYLHEPSIHYKSTEPLVDAILSVDDHISIILTQGDYLVTVVRKKIKQVSY